MAGENRYETAVLISQQGWFTSSYIVVATGENFPDALSGAPLAKAYDAPLLINPPTYLSTNIKNEINRLGAKTCFILGGTGAISSAVYNQILNNTSVVQIIRIGGENRYETAKLIAVRLNAVLGGINTAIIATGDNFPDALSVSPLAGFKGYPILLTQKNALPGETKNALNLLGITNTIIVGGTGVISSSVESQLPYPSRKSGTNRYATATEIIKFSISSGMSWNEVLIAAGNNFPDALTGGAYGAKIGAPLLLTDPNNLNNSSEIKTILEENSSYINKATIIGGSGAVSTTVKYQIEDIIF